MTSSRPSPSSSSSPPNNSNSPFLPASFGSNSSSQTTMTADVWRSPVERKSAVDHNTSILSPTATVGSVDQTIASIYIRKLPGNASEEALRSMLLFAKDLVDASYISRRHPDDKGFQTAVAHFKTLAGAKEARDRLNGKANATNEANMVVELLDSNSNSTSNPGPIGTRRNTVDGASHKSPTPANLMNGQGKSRYNGTFQSMEKMSPPSSTPGLGNSEFPVPESSAPMQNLFSPTSPVSNSFPHRTLGKTLITNGDGEDDSDGLLQESIGIGTGHPAPAPTRRTTNPSIPVSRFANLSLNTTHGGNGMSSPPIPSFTSPRSAASLQSPNAQLNAMSPHGMNSNMTSMDHNSNYQQFNQQYTRQNYPPVNPADQNPPCNTLYVGNLPIDTSEDELKAMFSKQRGYKRLCFRTKQNGPMCFVEFEDVSFATKALNELYGHPLHNSVKGGIRLSFSKNPLGVRTGQNNNMGQGQSTPLTPQASIPGLSNALGMPPGFSTAIGPPPGLAVPPGLHSSGSINGASNFGMFASGGFGVGTNDVTNPMRSKPAASVATSVAGNTFNGMGVGYQNYMMGR